MSGGHDTATFADLGPILVVVPTYNEKDNLERIVGRVRAAVPEAHVLVADDNSPDGTGQIADRLAAADDHVHVMHRMGKEGLGAAYLAGFAWALEHGYEVVVPRERHLASQQRDRSLRQGHARRLQDPARRDQD